MGKIHEPDLLMVWVMRLQIAGMKFGSIMQT